MTSVQHKFPSENTTLYDPPSGWRYGFPKPYLPADGESLADTLLRDGYPQREIENGGARHCRFIGAPAQEQLAPANDNAPVRERFGDFMQVYSGAAFLADGSPC
jgi:hypothetical protein